MHKAAQRPVKWPIISKSEGSRPGGPLFYCLVGTVGREVNTGLTADFRQ